MEHLDYDVVIVGAGPAGTFTAKHILLYRPEAKVLILEKRQEIGSPVRCGEGMSMAWLEELHIKPDPRWIAHTVQGMNIISPSGYKITTDLKMAGRETGHVVYRDMFDRALAADAARAGADLMVKTSATRLIKKDSYIEGVEAMHDGKKLYIESEIVVGADGYESQVGRWAGIDTTLKPSDVCTCFQYTLVGIDIDPRYNNFYVGNDTAPGGYVWVFPKGEDIANVGIGVLLSRVLKEPNGAPKRYLDKFIADHECLSKGTSVREVAGAISACMPLDCTVGDGILLVGDAARQIDPLTGGGVVNACKAGMIAGEAIAEALEAEDYSREFLMTYDTRWKEALENDMIRNWIAKNKISTLDDETFDNIIHSLSMIDFIGLTTGTLLQAIQERFPELTQELAGLL